MTMAIRIHQTGGPEVLRWEQIEVGDPGPGQVRLKQTACGLNYIDVYGRSGLYPVGDLPAVIGMEAVGTVAELGEGVAVAYDSIGKATFEASLDSLRPFGVMVTYGNASGKVEPFSPAILAPRGSLYVTRPTLATHISTPALLQEGADRLFAAVTSGQVRIHVNQEFALADCAEAHRKLEARETTGSTIMNV